MTEREARHLELAERWLPDELLERIRARAATFDRDQEFAAADIDDLRAHGYLTLCVPESLGGAGLSMHEVSRLQQRLATASPATALAINMHVLCTAVARTMALRGDTSLDHVLEGAANGEIYAFGISEPGNDLVLGDSTTSAVPDPSGLRLTGTKIFTSLAPVWTRILVHARDDSLEGAPQLVFGFLDRGSEGVAISDEWDVTGMRSSHSRATFLRGALMRETDVVRRIPLGERDLLVFAIASGFQLLVASVYAGLAARALDVAASALRSRTSAQHGTVLAEVPEYRSRIARAHAELLVTQSALDALTRDLDDLVDHGTAWSVRLVAARLSAGAAARLCAETALVCAGGAGYGSGHEASRLWRDAAASNFHPPSEDAALPMFASALLDTDDAGTS